MVTTLQRATAPPKFSIRPSSTAPFAVPIPLFSCADAGSFVASPPIVPALNLRAPDTELRLLHAMGYETANIHLGTPSARKLILRHIDKQKGKWLHHAAEAMLLAVRSDWEVWKKKGYV